MRFCPVCEENYDDSVTLCPHDGARTASSLTPKKTAPPVDPLIGRMVGSYKITRLLGKGGMGAVYAAEHPAIGSRVAVKFLLAQLAQDKNVVTRFFNEAKAVNLINHDNIVKVTDYSYLDDKQPYFVMEMLGDGYELGKLPTPVTLDVAGPIVLQICDALAAAHDNNIIHRDLKPDNVFLAVRNGRKHYVKLMDFGIAKLTGEGSQGQTQTGMVMGTPHYMSPEQAGGQSSAIDARSDIYSLGVMMYQLATGKLPFKGESFAETLVAHMTQPPVPPRQLKPDIPPAWEAVILRTLEKRPDDRYQSTRELAHDVAEVMKEHGCSFELPRADGRGPGAGGEGTDAPTEQVSRVRQTTRPEPRTVAVSPGTVALSTKEAQARPSVSPGLRAAVWIACLFIGFGALVGLKRAGVITDGSEPIVRELATAKNELARVSTQAAPPVVEE